MDVWPEYKYTLYYIVRRCAVLKHNGRPVDEENAVRQDARRAYRCTLLLLLLLLLRRSERIVRVRHLSAHVLFPHKHTHTHSHTHMHTRHKAYQVIFNNCDSPGNYSINIVRGVSMRTCVRVYATKGAQYLHQYIIYIIFMCNNNNIFFSYGRRGRGRSYKETRLSRV